MRMEQFGESAELKQEQLFDKNEMLQDHTHQKGIMALEMSHLKSIPPGSERPHRGDGYGYPRPPLLCWICSQVQPADGRAREAARG